jgi:Ca2+-binding RTX toxin-like protein
MIGHRDTRRATLVLAAAGTSLVVLATPALAIVSATSSAGGVSIGSDAGNDSMVMACDSGDTVVNGGSTAPAIACTAVETVSVVDSGGTDNVNLGAVSLAAFPALTRVSVDVESNGVDSVIGSDVRDSVLAGTGDTVASGGGDDRIEGASNADGGSGDDLLIGIANSVQGGPGSDTLFNPQTGPIDGGAGYDTVVLDTTPFDVQQPINFQLTDSAIISVVPLDPPVTITTPSSAVEEYEITLLSGPMNDTVASQGYSGRVRVRMMGGADSFVGGVGQDVVDGGPGNDTLNAGDGADVVRGGDGNDTLSARDGTPDVIDCGEGTDSVVADRVDVVSGCETVSLPAPDTGKIAGPKKTVKGQKATFTFASEVPGALFECQVDKGRFKACKSPFRVKTSKLALGKHTLKVRAVQPAGNADPTPSTFKFKVIAP